MGDGDGKYQNTGKHYLFIFYLFIDEADIT